ncbi:MAG TPA: hypothetical protein VHG91_20935 [Longimicrobium sp.]|nr:hypothetical protein [Longimicrobium sp.]
MHYDDTARRFNLVRGLVFGAVLGAGLALALSPRAQGAARAVLRAGGSVRRKALRGGDGAEEGGRAKRKKFEL